MSRAGGAAGSAGRGRKPEKPTPAVPGGRRRTDTTPPAWRHALWIVPTLAAMAAYLPALGNGFVWDDPLVLQQLRAIRGLGDLLVVPPEIPRLYYRPVVFASFLFDRALGGEQPFWFHASVIVWHAANTAMVFFLARILLAPRPRPLDPTRADWFAAAAALLFAIHPVHVESVAWMAGRSDVIACAFLLGAFLLHLRGDAIGAWLGGTSLLFALLTKEPVVLAAGALPLLDWSLGRPRRPARYLPFILAVPLYLAMRAGGAGLLGEPTLPSDAGLLDVVRALGLYVGKALQPLGQDVYYQEVPGGAAYLLLGVASIVGFGALFLWGWRTREAAVVVPIAWFAATLAPALGLVLRRIAFTPVAERYVYIPSVGAVILVAWLLLRLAERTRRERLVLGLCAVVGIAGFVEIGRRNHPWTDEILFWTAAAEATTDSTPQREVADALLRRGRAEEAEAAYLLALERPAKPEERAVTYSNLGNLYSRGPRVEEGIALFEKALEIRPHPSFHHGLGLAQMRRAERAQAAGNQRAVVQAVVAARFAFEQAIALGTRADAPPAFRQWAPAKTHLLLGQVLLTLEQRDLARQHLERALRLEPSGITADTARQFLARIPPPG